MTVNEIQLMVQQSPEYGFIKENEHLKDNVILLCLGGSYAYGTNTEDSDIDLRGCALNTKNEILTNVQFEQFTDKDTDTTIYGFSKLIHLLSNCNPNVIELLGLKPEHYLYMTDIGRELVANADMFLSKRAFYTFGGYAYSQLRRLDNKAMRKLSQPEQEQHILNSINNASATFKEKYKEIDSIRLYIDESENLESEIFMDINLTHYPLRDYKGMWAEMNNIVKEYGKLGHRNENAAKRGKLGKHMCHLIRLYLMCHDILINQKIVTYRGDEHDLLMDIRNGKYLDDNDQPTKEFMEMVEYYQRQLEEDNLRSELPKSVDMNRINGFMADVNERVVREEL